MNRNQIEIIENNVTVPQVLDLHRVKRRGNRCRCPIHNGDRDSFSYTDRLFHCFQCDEGGGVIQLEAKIDGVSDDVACQILARQFGLDIEDRPFTKQDKADWVLAKRVERDYKDYQTKKNTYYLRMSNLYRNIKDMPELSDITEDLGKWLDENINGVVQQWEYLSLQQKTF